MGQIDPIQTYVGLAGGSNYIKSTSQNLYP